MKKGKEMKDNKLDNVQGGYILRKDYPVAWGCIDPFPAYQVVDEEGNDVGGATAYFDEAERTAKDNNLSTEIINESQLKKLKNRKKSGTTFNLFPDGLIHNFGHR